MNERMKEKEKRKPRTQDNTYNRKKRVSQGLVREGKATANDVYRRGGKRLVENIDGGNELRESINNSEKTIRAGIGTYKKGVGIVRFIKRRKHNRSEKKRIKRELKEALAIYGKTRKDRKTLKSSSKREFNNVKIKGPKKKLPINAKLIAQTKIKDFTKKNIFNSSEGSNEMALGLSGLSFLSRVFGRMTFLVLKVIVGKFKKYMLIGGLFMALIVIIGTALPMMIAGGPIGIIMNGFSPREDSPASLLKASFASFNSKIQDLSNSHVGADKGNIKYDMKSNRESNFNDIIAVFAVKYGKNGELTEGILDTTQRQNLVFLFQKAVSYETSTATFTESGQTKKVFNITVHMKTWEELSDIYSFTQDEKDQVKEIMNAIGDANLSDNSIPVRYEGEGNYNDANASDLQKSIAYNAANGISDQPPIYGWCAAWVRGVYSKSGIYWGGAPDAGFYWDTWSYTGSTSMTNIPLGAAVILSRTTANGGYGHIGIYIGNGMVASNLGYVKVETVESFATTNGASWVGWVWPGGKVLAKPE